ncbi:MAG: VOC family protein [Rhizomicrobium sp.]|jgi:catechol 2,3-dioxygenase-like lactoylglutathione lyase family enzyme
MIDHISIAVRNLAKSAAFYEAVLAPLELAKLVDRAPATVGFGRKYPEFWLNAREELAPQPETTGTHICLRAPGEEAVRAFHVAALANGGKTAGDPGPRQAAFTTYYGAFIFDPDGNKIEAVFFPKKLGDGTGFEGKPPG